MEDIRMMATKAFYAKLKPELDAAFSTVMASMDFSSTAQEEKLTETLKAYFGISFAKPCATAASAFKIALSALKLPTNAEVILSAYGDKVFAQIVVEQGYKPVFADVHPDTFLLDITAVEKAIMPATAAMVPSHLFGQVADMEALMQLAAKYNLKVIEDATQAFGAEVILADGHKAKAGSIGHVSLAAFFPAKATGNTEEGAAILTNDPILAASITKLNLKDQLPDKLDALQAAMLDVKVKHIAEYNAGRAQAVTFYNKNLADLPGLQLPVSVAGQSHIYQQYPVLVKQGHRDKLQQHLSEHFIPSIVPFPKPLHLQEEFMQLGYKAGDFPVAEQLSQSILLLPHHSELKEDQLNYICQNVKGFFDAL